MIDHPSVSDKNQITQTTSTNNHPYPENDDHIVGWDNILHGRRRGNTEGATSSNWILGDNRTSIDSMANPQTFLQNLNETDASFSTLALSPSSSSPTSPSGERRVKPKVRKACLNCRRAHARCSEIRPCRSCVLAGKAHTCEEMNWDSDSSSSSNELRFHPWTQKTAPKEGFYKSGGYEVIDYNDVEVYSPGSTLPVSPTTSSTTPWPSVNSSGHVLPLSPSSSSSSWSSSPSTSPLPLSPSNSWSSSTPSPTPLSPSSRVNQQWPPSLTPSSNQLSLSLDFPHVQYPPPTIQLASDQLSTFAPKPLSSSLRLSADKVLSQSLHPHRSLHPSRSPPRYSPTQNPQLLSVSPESRQRSRSFEERLRPNPHTLTSPPSSSSSSSWSVKTSSRYNSSVPMMFSSGNDPLPIRATLSDGATQRIPPPHPLNQLANYYPTTTRANLQLASLYHQKSDPSSPSHTSPSISPSPSFHPLPGILNPGSSIGDHDFHAKFTSASPSSFSSDSSNIVPLRSAHSESSAYPSPRSSLPLLNRSISSTQKGSTHENDQRNIPSISFLLN